MEPLIVSKTLERRGKLGPFYLHEVVFLTLGCVLLFLGVMLFRSFLSRRWLLSAPSLFFVVMLLVKALRSEAHPLLLLSWFSFHYQQPRRIAPKRPQALGTLPKEPGGTQRRIFENGEILSRQKEIALRQ